MKKKRQYKIMTFMLCMLIALAMILVIPGAVQKAYADDLQGDAYVVFVKNGETVTVEEDGAEQTADALTMKFIRSTQTDIAMDTDDTSITDIQGKTYKGIVLPCIETSEYKIDEKQTPGWISYPEIIERVTKAQFIDSIKTVSAAFWFSGMSNLKEITGINELYNVRDMAWMFSDCRGLTSLDVSRIDTEKVTDMKGMFNGCSGLTNLDVSNFKTGNVVDMSHMFNGCRGLTSLDVSRIDTEKVTDMSYMFNGCSGLTSLDVNNFNTGNVTDMQCMFSDCNGLINLDVSNFDTKNVTDMNFMFDGCESLTNLNISNFNTGNVTGMNSMFEGCSDLTSLNVSNFDTGKVIGMTYMFYGCKSLKNLDVSNFNTGNVTKMYSMFDDCNGLTSLDVSRFDIGKVINMSYMFRNCSGLTSLNLRNFNLSDISDEALKDMFKGTCSSNESSTPCKGYARDSAAAARFNNPDITGIDTDKLKFAVEYYTITYNNLNGASNPNRTEYTSEDDDISLQNLSRAGYNFDGWYENSDFSGNKVTTIKKGSTGNKILYAKWTKVEPRDDNSSSSNSSTDNNSSTNSSSAGNNSSANNSSAGSSSETNVPQTPSPDQKISDASRRLTATKGDKSPAGSKFSKLKLRYYKAAQKSISLKWSKVKGASSYVLYGNKCGSKYKKLAQVTGTKKKMTKVAGKKLKKGTYYKFFVAAFDKDGNQISVSKTIHVATTGGKVGNYKSVKVTNVKKGKKTLKKGKSFILKTRMVKQSKKLKVKKHAKLAFESSNKSIATVSSKGKIKAKKKGTCTIYIYTQSGTYTKVRIKVK